MKTGALALKDDDKSDDEEDEMSQKDWVYASPAKMTHAKLAHETLSLQSENLTCVVYERKPRKGKFKIVSNWFERPKYISQVCVGRRSQRNTKYSYAYSKNKIRIFLQGMLSPSFMIIQKIYLTDELDIESDKKKMLNARDHCGCTAMHNAIIRNHRGVLLYLINQGADINIQDNIGKL